MEFLKDLSSMLNICVLAITNIIKLPTPFIIGKVRIRLLLVFFFAAITCSMAQTHVQTTTLFQATTSPTIARTFTSASTTGNLIVVHLDWSGQSRSISTVTDNKGNTYQRINGPTNWDGSNYRTELWYAYNITGGAGNITITATLNGAPTSFFQTYISEYSGISTTDPLDQNSVAIGNTNPVSSGFKSTTWSKELIYGASIGASGALFTGGGFTNRSAANNNIIEDKNASTTGSYDAAFTSAGGNWVAQMATFFAAPVFTTGTISGSPFCAGANVSVPFTIDGSFATAKVFTAQLSNASGSFAAPVNIGTLSSVSSGTILATIPAGTAAGVGYRIRVVSSAPAIAATVNGSNLTVNSLLVAPTSISGTTAICNGSSTTLTAEGGMVAYYPFTSNLNDYSGSGLNLTGSGGSFTGGGIQLSNASTYTSVVTPILNTDKYTISFDMKYTAAPTMSWGKIFGYTPSGTDRSPGIWKYDSAMKLHWRHDPGNTGLAESFVYTINQWYRVVGEKNGSTFTLYVDGVQVDQGTIANPKTSGTAALVFGAAGGYGGADVILKEFKIYNGVLKWYTGSCGGTLVGSGPSITVTPATSTTYFVREEGTCNTTSCASQLVTVNGNVTAAISGGSTPICYNTAPGTLTATGGGGTGSYTYLWYKNGISTGVTTQTYSPGAMTATSTFYCAITSGSCGTINTSTTTIVVTANNTVSLTSAGGTNAQTVCINTPITNITYSTTGATGGAVTNLPTGVTGSWSGNVVTISGTPTLAGVSKTYTVTLTGGCGTVTTTGTIAVTANNSVSLTSAGGTNAQTVCVNNAITPITYSTTGATGATVTNLPTGVTSSWSGNVVTISGTPTVAGASKTYTVTLTGGCGTVTTTGTIAVTANNTVSLTSAGGTNAQTVCINTPITNITYSTIGASGATVTNLPTGVTGSWSGNVVTISGTPTVAGASKTYTVTLTGGCGTVNATGTITVTANMTASAASSSPTLCVNTLMTNITHATTLATGIGTASGLPAGVTAAFASNTITISGTPTASGVFPYTIPLTGGCGTVNATGTITVTPVTWLGTTNTDWHTASNWCGGIPTAITNVTIPSGTPNQPVIGAAAVCNNITINPGASLTITGSNTLTASGSWTNNGAFTPNMSTVIFNGLGISLISPTTFYNLTISGTGTKKSTGNIVVNANFTLNSGAFEANTSNTLSYSLTVKGNYLQTGGLFDFNPTGGGALTTLNIAGNLTNTAAANSITTIGPGAFNGQIVFNGSAIQTVSFSNPTASIWTTYTVNSGSSVKLGTDITLTGDSSDPRYYADFIVNGTIDFQTYILKDIPYSGTNASHFVLNGGANLLTANPNGISLAANTGSVQFLGSRTYNAGANYTYNGTSAQITGNGLSAANNLTINNNAGVTLSGPVSVAGILTLSNGIVTTTVTNLLSVTNTATTAISGGSSTIFINGPLNRRLPANLGSGTTYNFPVGNGTTYLPFNLLNPTTGAGIVTAQVKAFASDSGGTIDGTLASISNSEYWSLVTGGNFTNSSVSLTRQTAIAPLNVIGASTAVGGPYTSLAGTTGTYGVTSSNTIDSNRFFVLAMNKNYWIGMANTDWNDPLNWSIGIPTNGVLPTLNVVIPSSGVTYYPIIFAGDPAGYVNSLELENNTTLNVVDNSLRVTDNLKLDGKIDLEGESQLLQDLGSTLDPASSGTLERDQQGTADKYTYNYWSSPVGVANNLTNNNPYKLPEVIKNIGFLTSGYDGTASPVRIADYWIWKFSNKTSGDYSQWQHVRSTGTMLIGEGFTMKGPGTGSIPALQNYVFEGKPNNGDINLTISTGNNYLIGNPYPSALDADQFITDNDAVIGGTGSITGTLYFWQHWGGGSHILSEYQGGYATYTLADGAPAPFMGIPPPGFLTTPGRYIPVAQGFFVTAETDGSINFNNGQRVFQIEDSIQSVFIKSSNPKTAGKQVEDTRSKIRLGLNSVNQIHRELLVTVDPNTTPGYDWGYDALNIDTQIDDMYWLIDADKYIIQATDQITDETILPIGIHVRNDGINTITINKLENTPDNLMVFVHDKELNSYHNLSQGAYEVFLLAGDYLNRFEITFANTNALDVNDVNNDSSIDVFYSNEMHSIIIQNPGSKEIRSVEMFNVLGQSIFKFDTNSNKTYLEYGLAQINTGVYIVNLKTEFGKLSKKVLIK